MIVDDNCDVLAVTKIMLERKGYNVHAFKNGSQALKHLIGCKDCRIVISDIMMPEMTGIELGLYAKKAKPEIKFVLMSAMPIDKRDWRTILPSVANIDDFIAKPFSVEEIADIIMKYAREQPQRNGV